MKIFALAACALGLMAQEPLYHDPGLKKMVQVAIVCRDIEATTQRWAAFLGVDAPKILVTKPGHEVKMTFRGKPSEARAKLAFIDMGQMNIEFIQPIGGPSSWQQYLDANGEGVQHVAFEVQDLKKSLETARKLGCPVMHEGLYDDASGDYHYLDSQKQLGVAVEILHSAPKK